jgi:class 3 adenylate cyclase
MADESKPDQDKQDEGTQESQSEHRVGNSEIVDPPQPPQPPPPQPGVIQEPEFPWKELADRRAHQNQLLLNRRSGRNYHPYSRLPPDPQMIRRSQEIEAQITALTSQLVAAKEAIAKHQGTEMELAAARQEIVELSNRITKLIQEKEKAAKEQEEAAEFADMIRGVNDSARKYLETQDGKKLFNLFKSSEWTACVMSVDIRRSTGLMLKAKPLAFGAFLSDLHAGLEKVVLDNYGYLDKFTGDGILAFFPSFFSGEDFAYLAVKSAAECHDVFEEVYRNHRKSFKAVMLDAALGIGIDCGDIQPVSLSGHLTGIGEPVVYACRIGTHPVGKTFVNQGVHDELKKRHGPIFIFSETEVDFKHEGRFLAYEVRFKEHYLPKTPSWLMNAIPGAPSLVQWREGYWQL